MTTEETGPNFLKIILFFIQNYVFFTIASNFGICTLGVSELVTLNVLRAHLMNCILHYIDCTCLTMTRMGHTFQIDVFFIIHSSEFIIASSYLELIASIWSV